MHGPLNIKIHNYIRLQYHNLQKTTKISAFCDNMMYASYDRLWKMGTIFDKLSDSYAKYYRPNDQLIFEITVRSSNQSIYTKEQQKTWHGSYKLCNSKRYRPTYNTAVYLGNDRNMQLLR